MCPSAAASSLIPSSLPPDQLNEPKRLLQSPLAVLPGQCSLPRISPTMGAIQLIGSTKMEEEGEDGSALAPPPAPPLLSAMTLSPPPAAVMSAPTSRSAFQKSRNRRCPRAASTGITLWAEHRNILHFRQRYTVTWVCGGGGFSVQGSRREPFADDSEDN